MPSDYYEDSYYSSFSYDYSDGNYGYGSFFTDVITLGGVGVSSFSMGLVNESSRWIGTLGLGYNDSTYSNLPDRLFESGLINSTAYSIWLDDEEASTGSLLFGAVDTSKYSGNLTRINASKYSSGYSSFGVYLYSVNGTSTDSLSAVNIESDELPISISVSPSDAISILPTDLAEQIWQMTGATFDEDYEKAFISCDAANGNQTFTFQLGGEAGPIVEATMSDLVVPQDVWDYSSYTYYDDEDTDTASRCLFGIQNSSYSYYSYYDYYTLGSTLLRRTYAVFDLVNQEVAVAPVNFGSDESNVVPFPVYGATIPSATLKCGTYGCYTGTATSYATGGSGSGGGSSGGSGDDDISGGSGGSSSTGGLLPSAAVVGAALGAGIGALAIGGIVLLILKHRKRSKEPSPELAAEIVNRGQGTEAQALGAEQAGTRENEKAREVSLPTPPPPVVLPRISETGEARRSQEEASDGHGHGKSTNV